MYISGRLKIGFILIALSCCWLACKEQVTPANTPKTIAPNTAIEKPPLPGVDKSPMDMAYYPVEYPKLKMSGNLKTTPVARVVYSRPQRNGRIIFGDVVKYGAVWRLGANEATEIEFFQNVTVDNQRIEKGRYILYCIPFEDKWTLVLNSDLFTWGLKIDSTKDLYKFSIPIKKTNYPFEVFTMEFANAGKDAVLVMEWDSVQAKLPFKF